MIISTELVYPICKHTTANGPNPLCQGRVAWISSLKGDLAVTLGETRTLLQTELMCLRYLKSCLHSATKAYVYLALWDYKNESWGSPKKGTPPPDPPLSLPVEQVFDE